jgi:tRNA wybutosine-synthesizing protein 3
MAAGFRESGALSLTGTEQQLAMPAVAVRTNGLAFQSMIGVETDGQRHMLVSEEYLGLLADVGNERFQENSRRIARFQAELQKAATTTPKGSFQHQLGWEDPVSRRARLRAEGLQRQKQLATIDRSDEEAKSPSDDLPLSIPNT